MHLPETPIDNHSLKIEETNWWDRDGNENSSKSICDCRLWHKDSKVIKRSRLWTLLYITHALGRWPSLPKVRRPAPGNCKCEGGW